MEPIQEGGYYHIYNRGAGRAPIFYSNEDYEFFLKKYFYYLYISTETCAWCLLKNHIHLLIYIRPVQDQERIFETVKATYPKGSFFGDAYESIKPFDASKQFAHLFNSYTKYINMKNNRSGTLIEGSFKRKRIQDENHFLHIVCYIHRNPLHHGFTNSYEDYPYSSYSQVLKKSNIKIDFDHKNVLARFGGKQNYLDAHQEFKMMLGEEYYLE